MNTVQYIIVRKDIADTISIGQLAAQVAHASLAPLTSRLNGNFEKTIDEVLDEATKLWVIGPFIKIVLEVPNENKLLDIMERLYADGIAYNAIRESTLDRKLTCIGLKPYNKGRVAKYFKGLKMLGATD